jgi:enediyne biosynthesis protein E4
VTQLDFDNDGWPDIFIANDTQPNKLYQNLRNGKFQEVGVRAGVAFSEDGKARAGMGVDAADLDNTGIPTLAVTNFHNEMLALYKGRQGGLFHDLAPGSEIGRVTRGSLGFGCFFFDADLDGRQDLLVINGHIDNTVRNTQYAQPPHLFLNTGNSFREIAAEVGSDFAAAKVGRGAAFGDFDNDGDLDVLITTNGGPAYLYRNDQLSGNRSIRFKLVGTESNRDAIGAMVRISFGGQTSTRTVKSGGSYLSQSELPVTFGLGKQESIDRVTIRWPRGRAEEYKNLKAGRYEIVEGKGIELQKR